jgi:hypothetical protein
LYVYAIIFPPNSNLTPHKTPNELGFYAVCPKGLYRPHKQTIKLEREFNHRAGFTKEDDRLSEWMTKEALPENNAMVGKDVLDHNFDGIE